MQISNDKSGQEILNYVRSKLCKVKPSPPCICLFWTLKTEAFEQREIMEASEDD